MNINNMNNYNNMNDNEIEVNIVEKIANGYDFDDKWKIDAIDYLKSERLTKSYSGSNILPGGFIPRDVFGNVIPSRPPRSPPRPPRSPPRPPISLPQFILPKPKINKISEYYKIDKQLYYKSLYIYISVLILCIVYYIYYT